MTNAINRNRRIEINEYLAKDNRHRNSTHLKDAVKLIAREVDAIAEIENMDIEQFVRFIGNIDARLTTIEAWAKKARNHARTIEEAQRQLKMLEELKEV